MTLKPFRYIGKILRPATSEEVRNEHLLQKQKKVFRRSKAYIIKMYGTCQGKRIGLKNKIKEEMTEHVCPTKGTLHFGILWSRSKWSVIESSAVTVPETSDDHRVDIPRKRDL